MIMMLNWSSCAADSYKKYAGYLPAFFLYLGKFVIFEFQSVAYINAEGQQGDGDFGNHTGIIVLDEGVVTADINDGA